MPKLPKAERPRVPHEVACYLEHRASTNGASYFGVVARKWFDADPNAKIAFIKWYEKQP